MIMFIFITNTHISARPQHTALLWLECAELTVCWCGVLEVNVLCVRDTNSRRRRSSRRIAAQDTTEDGVHQSHSTHGTSKSSHMKNNQNTSTPHSHTSYADAHTRPKRITTNTHKWATRAHKWHTTHTYGTIWWLKITHQHSLKHINTRSHDTQTNL